jgi:UDP-N-acetylmuramate dehydrogenase
MDIKENFSLKPFNTFGIDVKASLFCEVNSIDELNTLLSDERYKKIPKLFLGSGSNILFTSDFDGIVIKISLKGIQNVSETDDFVIVKSGAGVIWDDLVVYCIENNLSGIENLSLIPGTAGAAPIQNIGAYGVEIKDIFYSLEALNIETNKIQIFSKDDCKFSYRNSIFKNEFKNKFVITSIKLKLNKKPNFNIAYGAIKDVLNTMGIKDISIKAIREAVCDIRRSKLPNPVEIGNAGSFFKNPEIPEEQFLTLREIYPDIINYKTSPGMVKIPAGWLIEKAGWKGKTFNECGVHQHQALVLVNYGNAKGTDIQNLALNVSKSVFEEFGISLETEVNII